MKVLGIVCSPRKQGNTEIMMETALTGARSLGAETELWTAVGKDLKPCDGCDICTRERVACHINDDMPELYGKIVAADGLIFGSPSYFGFATAQAKIVMDRLYSLYNQSALVDKVAGVLSVASSSGNEQVRAEFTSIIQHCHMFPADHAKGFASKKGEVKKDDYAMRSSEELGKQIVSLIKQGYHWPEAYRKPMHNVIGAQYGILSYPLRHTRQVE